MAKQLTALAKGGFRLGDYAGTAINSGIVLATTGIEQLTTIAVYRCPCVPLTLLPNCTFEQSRTNCQTQLLNYSYGLAFIVAPAIGLLVFGLASNPRTWKTLTGVYQKTDNQRRSFGQIAWTLVVVCSRAFIAPITWCAIAMLDGKYYACAVTAVPYDIAGTSPTYKDCELVAKTKSPYTSDMYNTNRSFSQLVGWITLGGGLLVGMVLYTYAQCILPMTYYHAKYFNFYRASEEAEFDDEMKKKAQKDAENNVLKFMEKPRQKSEWDKISTVYEFHRDKRNLALYSNLDEWVKKTKSEEERHLLLEGDGVTEAEDIGKSEDEDKSDGDLGHRSRAVLDV